MKRIVFFASLVITGAGCQKSGDGGSGGAHQLYEYIVSPDSTDANINTALKDHYAYINTSVALKNELFVFLPGSGAEPGDYRAIVQKAADMGYHAIGLMYPDYVIINGLCAGSSDTTCHTRARREIIDGIDRHPDIHVDTANCIINRLVRLLQYLQARHPSQNWSQFLDGDQPAWPKIIVSGHSQGAGNAAVMGKYYSVKRVVMFSDIDFFTNGKYPDWMTPAHSEKYYAIIHPKDELLDYPVVQGGWQRLGMTAYGGVVNVDSAAAPYHNTHTLITRVDPAFNLFVPYHNSTAVDLYMPKDSTGAYVFDKTWEYLLGN